MGDLSKNISRSETACKCGCGLANPDPISIDLVQQCCDRWAVRLFLDRVVLRINRWCSCVRHNKEVGGAPESKHLPDPKTGFCGAVDFSIDGVTPEQLAKDMDTFHPLDCGIGLYPGRIHFDNRQQRTRWTEQPDGSLKYT